MAEFQSGQNKRSLPQALQAIGLLERLVKAAKAQSRFGSVIRECFFYREVTAEQQIPLV